MFKRKLSLLIILTLLLSLCGCSSKPDKSLPELIIGCDNVRPYCYIDEEGEFAGIDVDIAREVCKRVGYEPVFKQINWKNRENYIKNGEVDCLWTCLSMDNSNNDLAWVGPYMYSHQVVAVLKDSPLYTLEDLNEKEIAVKIGSMAENAFSNYDSDYYIPNVRNLYCLDNTEFITTALRNKYVDACAGDSVTLTELLDLSGAEYRFFEEDLSYTRLGIAFSKASDADLRKTIKDILNKMRTDGTIEQIFKAHGVNAVISLNGGRRR